MSIVFWRDRFEKGQANVDQIQRLLNVGVITQEEFNAYEWPDELDNVLVKRAEALDYRIDNRVLKLLLLPLVESKPEEEQETFSFLFPAWRPDIDVLVDEKRQHEELLYKCLQAHRTQSDWLPNNTPALWVRVATPGTVPVWVQPTGAHDAYDIGDEVQWPEGGTIWESTINANTTVPGENTAHGYWIEI